MAISLILLTSLSTMADYPAPFEVHTPNHPVYGFEDTVPAEFAVGDHGTLSVVKDRFKAGEAALRWDWSAPDGRLTFTNGDAFKHLTGRDPDPIVFEWITFTSLSTFSVWVFNETPIDDVLWFEIGDGETVDCRFWMRLDFTGWRPCQAMYGRDIGPLGGFPGPNATTLRIIPPKSRPTGSLWFDDFAPRREHDVRFVRPSSQVPWVRPQHSQLKNDDFVKGRWTEDRVATRPVLQIALPDTLSDEQAVAIDRIRSEFIGWTALPEPKTLDGTVLEKLRSVHATHRFMRSGDSISGEIGNMKGYWGEANRIATVYWQAAEQPEMQAELLGMYTDFIDLVIEQGHGAGYGLRTAFAQPVWLMKGPLIESQRWQPLLERLRDIVSVEDFYSLEAYANADVYNTVLNARLFVILLEDDNRIVWRDLTALRHWLDRTAQYGEIRPDGSLFHHNQTYTGYNLPAIGPWVRTLHLLRDTEFLSSISHLYAYRTVFAMHWYACMADIPHTLGGRWRNTAQFSGTELYRELAELGAPRLGGLVPSIFTPKTTLTPATVATYGIDPLMASLYLYGMQLADKTDEWTEKYTAMGIQPAITDGNLALNHTVASIHRRDDWMVFFRGQRNPFFSTDMYPYQAGNTMGRYISYGHMAIFSRGTPTNAKDSGWDPPKGTMGGWNFNFWPGTTTRELPFEALRAQFSVEEPVTAETFAVGTHLAGNGIFGMKLREDELDEVDPLRIGPVRYWLGEKEYARRIEASMFDPSFRARKSVFMFDDRILCLGSGINSSDPDHRVVTTLQQVHLAPDRRELFLSSAIDVGTQVFPLNTRIGDSKPLWFVDSIGNGYYLPAGHAPLVIQRQLQKLAYHTHTNEYNPEINDKIHPNEGETELVLLDHGAAPRDATYQYCILIRADAARMETFAELAADPETVPYRVLLQSRAAHVVYDVASRTTGYILFDPHLAQLDSDDSLGPVISADRPCVVMAQALDDGVLAMSVSDPELGLADDGTQNGQAPHSAGTWLQIAVRGRWTLASPIKQVQATAGVGDWTLLRIHCRDLIPVTCHLKPIQENSHDH